MTTLRACFTKGVRGKKKPVLGQIFPGGVTTFDQADLPQPLPALDLLFARNGVPDVWKFLEVYEPGDAILAGEPRDEASFVLVHAPRQVIRYSGIEHPGATGHDVDVVGAHDPTGLSIGPAPPSSFFRRVGQFFRRPLFFFPPLSLKRACHPERARYARERRTCFFSLRQSARRISQGRYCRRRRS